MSLNCSEINLILSELNLEGAFVQDIVQPGYDSLALYTYKEGCAKTVFICTAQNECRLNETRHKIPKNEKPLRFMELLKSKIRGCRINFCEQIGAERIVKIQLSRHVEISEKPNEKTNYIKLASTPFNKTGTAKSESKIKEEDYIENYFLYIRLWNNAANVILTDENKTIIDCMFRRPEKNEISGAIFEEPAVDSQKIKEAEEKYPVRQWKTDEKAGVAGKMDKTEPALGVARNHVRAQGAAPSFNLFIENYYSEHAAGLSRDSLIEKAEKWYAVTKSRRENALNTLLQKKKEFENATQLKHQGDLILSYAYLVDGNSKYLECEDYETGKTVKLLINPAKSAQENATEYYKKYKKCVNGLEDLLHDIEIGKKQLEKLEKQYAQILAEKNPVKIEQLLRKNTVPKQQQKKERPGLDYLVNGWYILVGRDANENDELLRHFVRGDDLWLHVRDFPGGYVFVKAQKNKTVPLEILLDAANLAVYYSKARNATKVDLYYTHVKYLRRAKNGPKGLVLPSQEKNLCIKVDPDRLRRLDSLHKEQNL